MTIPPHLLIQDGFQKKVLRDSGKNILSDQIRSSKQKKGFNASINSIINFDDHETVNKIFNQESPIAEYINLSKIKNDINKNFTPNHISKLIFSIISTNLFLENAEL